MNVNPPSPIAKRLAIAGLVLHLGPVLGLLVTLWESYRTFTSLEGGDIGHNSGTITSSVQAALAFTIVGLVLRVIGMGLLAISVLFMRYRARWLFGWLVALSIWSLLGFPYFTIIGAAALVALIISRSQFLKNGEENASLPPEPGT